MGEAARGLMLFPTGALRVFEKTVLRPDIMHEPEAANDELLGVLGLAPARVAQDQAATMGAT